jgi:hypothetical protein
LPQQDAIGIEINTFPLYFKEISQRPRAVRPAFGGPYLGVRMSDVDQGSLQYFQSRACNSQWAGFLRALAEELMQQMPVEELRAFFFVIGGRIATQNPLPGGASLADLESNANAYFNKLDWGWVKVRDLQSSLEFAHSCAPLRQAFGDNALSWASGLLEGLYATWLRQVGAANQLELHQIGGAEGAVDTLRFRLAHPSYFA